MWMGETFLFTAKQLKELLISFSHIKERCFCYDKKYGSLSIE